MQYLEKILSDSDKEYILSFSHKICQARLSQNEQHLYISYCCSHLIKWNLKTLKMEKIFDGGELTSFSSFELLEEKNTLLFIYPNKFLKLNLNLEKLNEFEISRISHRLRKRKYQNKLVLSNDREFTFVVMEKTILCFHLQSSILISDYFINEDDGELKSFHHIGNHLMIIMNQKIIFWDFVSKRTRQLAEIQNNPMMNAKFRKIYGNL